MRNLFLGIDIGTFETKGVLLDTLGEVVASASRRHEISSPKQGHVEQDAEMVWWSDLSFVANELMKTAVARSGKISAMACSAIGPCVLPVDENMNPLRPGILYGIDSRAQDQISELNRRMGAEAIFEKSGNTLTSQSAGPKIMWISQVEPEIAAKTKWYLTSQSYLVAKLTSKVTMDHGTAGYFHPIYDLKRQKWDTTDLEDFVSMNQLPELGWATDIAGFVTAEAARQTGIPEGTPVAIGTTDSPAEAVGAGVVLTGDTMIQYGSAGYMINVLDEPITSADLWSAPFVFPNSYVSAAGTATAGTVTRWVADIIGIDDQGGDEKLFSELISLARESEVGANGVLMLPHLSGERTPVQNPDSRGIYFGLSLGNNRNDLARATLEGVAHSISHAFNTFALCGVESKNIKAIGGGTKNPIITSSVSAIIKKPQTVSSSVGAAFGDAAIAAFAVGHIGSRSEILNWVKTGELIEVDSEMERVLEQDHTDYVELYHATKSLAKARADRHKNG
jgi:xylulokinase